MGQRRPQNPLIYGYLPVFPSILSSLRGKNMVSSPSLEHFLYSLDTLFASVTVPKRRTFSKMTLLFSIIVTIEYWKCNFPMTRSVRRSVGCFVVRSVIISSKVGMLHFHAPIGALVSSKGTAAVCVIYIMIIF